MLQDCSTAPRPLVVNLCIRPYRCGGASNSVRYEVFDGFIFGRSSRDLQRSLVDAILTSEKRRSAICADSGGFVKMASRRDVWPGHYADRPMVEAWCCADFGGGGVILAETPVKVQRWTVCAVHPATAIDLATRSSNPSCWPRSAKDLLFLRPYGHDRQVQIWETLMIGKLLIRPQSRWPTAFTVQAAPISHFDTAQLFCPRRGCSCLLSQYRYARSRRSV